MRRIVAIAVLVPGLAATAAAQQLQKFNPEGLSTPKTYFGANKPASTLVQISQLASPEYKVEIEAIAVLP